TSGEADATIVYQTDVTAAGSKGEGVHIPDNQNVIADYPIAIVKATKNHPGAAAFVDAVVHGSGQAALQKRGFLAATWDGADLAVTSRASVAPARLVTVALCEP